jgi:hypothetical protein
MNANYTICISSDMIDIVVVFMCLYKLIPILWGWLADYLDMRNYKNRGGSIDER